MIVGNFNSVKLLIALDSYSEKSEKIEYLEDIKSNINRIINCFEETKSLPLKMFTSVTSDFGKDCGELDEFIKSKVKTFSSKANEKNLPEEGKIKGLLRSELFNYQKLLDIIDEEIVTIKVGKAKIVEDEIVPEEPVETEKPKQKKRSKVKDSPKLKGTLKKKEEDGNEEDRMIQEHRKLKEEDELDEVRRLKEESLLEEKRKLEKELQHEKELRIEEERKLEEKYRLEKEAILEEKRKLEEEHSLKEKNKEVEEGNVQENYITEESQIIQAITSRDRREKKNINYIMFESYSPEIVGKLLKEFKGSKIVWFSTEKKLVELGVKLLKLNLVDELNKNSLPSVISKNFVDGDKKKYSISQIEEIYRTMD